MSAGWYRCIPGRKYGGISGVELLQGDLPHPHRRVRSRVESHVEALCVRNVRLDVLSYSLSGRRICIYTYVVCPPGGGRLMVGIESCFCLALPSSVGCNRQLQQTAAGGGRRVLVWRGRGGLLPSLELCSRVLGSTAVSQSMWAFAAKIGVCIYGRGCHEPTQENK